jgi:hypothetical protein
MKRKMYKIKIDIEGQLRDFALIFPRSLCKDIRDGIVTEKQMLSIALNNTLKKFPQGSLVGSWTTSEIAEWKPQ